MAGNDPFAEPGDDGERTVIRPNPGGRRPNGGGAAPSPFGEPARPGPSGGFGSSVDAFGVPQQAKPATESPLGTAPDAQIAMTGMNTLVACAAPLFALISRIRNRAQHVDPDRLRQAVVAEVRAFESRALQAQIDPQMVKVARYALCSTLDDVVLNTPWGGQSNWALQSMVSTFHRENVGGDRFYDLLARLEQDPANNTDILEFLYTCLSLGFEGRLRVEDRGTDKHLQIRNSLARIIRGQRGAPERDLSPHWKGADQPYKPRSMWKPVWLALAVSGILLASIYSSLAFLLSRDAGPVLGAVQTAAPATVARLDRPAPPPPPPPPSEPIVEPEPGDPAAPLAPTVSQFLAPEIEAKKVEVTETNTEVVVRILGAGLFKAGSDQLEDGLAGVVDRIAEALAEVKGPILVVGHSDASRMGRNSRFKDNKDLSAARARTVQNLLAKKLEDTDRVSAEGRGEAEPIAPNDTPEGRALNRRVEVLLVKQE